MKKSLLLDSKEIEGQNISYRIFGEGDIDLVIEMGLGAVAGEWWHIAERLAKQFTVLLYERGRNISKPRSPKNIAIELHTLLQELPCKSKMILLAHSQGGLYAQQFARMYPDMVELTCFSHGRMMYCMMMLKDVKGPFICGEVVEPEEMELPEGELTYALPYIGPSGIGLLRVYGDSSMNEDEQQILQEIIHAAEEHGFGFDGYHLKN